MLQRLVDLLRNGPFPVPAATPVKLFSLNGSAAMLAYGTTVPSDTTAGYAAGCIFFKTNGAAGSVVYINEGTSSSCDFNPMTSISGLLATVDEINRVADVSARIVDCTASTLALTVALHDSKTVTLNRAAGIAISLPDSTAPETLGFRVKLVVGTTVTTTSVITITRDGTATFFGQIYQLADGGATLAAYELPGATVITLGTSSNTTGGTKGDSIELECVASGVWQVVGHTTAAGSEATPVT